MNKGILLVCLLSQLLLINSFNIADQSVSREELEQRLKRFNTWYHEFNPSTKNKLELRLDDYGQPRPYALTDFVMDGELFTINKSQIINHDHIFETKYKEFFEEIEEQYGYDDLGFLAVGLLTEMFDPESKWKPYLDILPPKPVSLVWDFWNTKDSWEHVLKGTSITSKIFSNPFRKSY